MPYNHFYFRYGQNILLDHFLVSEAYTNKKQAIYWLTKAAEQGYEDAIILLKELGLE